MKKILFSAGILALTAFTLVGCKDEKKIVVAAEASQKAHYEAAVQRTLEKHKDWEITVKEIGAFENIENIKKTGTVKNSDVADVFVAPLDTIKAYYQNGWFADIDTPRIVEKIGGYAADVPAEFQKFTSVDGKGETYFGVPSNIETLIGWVNKANAEANGVAKNAAGKYEINDLKQSDLRQAVFNGWFAASFLFAGEQSEQITMLKQIDGGKFASDLTKNYADLSAHQKLVFDYFYKTYESGGTELWNKDTGYSFIEKSFKSKVNDGLGTQSITIDGPWATSAMLERTNKGADLEVIPLSDITLSGKELSHWQGGWSFVVNARNEKNKAKIEVSEDLIAEILNTNHIDTYFLNGGKISPFATTAQYQALTTIKDIDKKVIEAVSTSFKTATAQKTFVEYAEVWKTWEQACLSWASESAGVTSAETAYKKVQAAFNTLVNTLNTDKK